MREKKFVHCIASEKRAIFFQSLGRIFYLLKMLIKGVPDQVFNNVHDSVIDFMWCELRFTCFWIKSISYERAAWSIFFPCSELEINQVKHLKYMNVKLWIGSWNFFLSKVRIFFSFCLPYTNIKGICYRLIPIDKETGTLLEIGLSHKKLGLQPRGGKNSTRLISFVFLTIFNRLLESWEIRLARFMNIKSFTSSLSERVSSIHTYVPL